MSTNPEALKVLHDRLLEQMPEGAEHDEDTCPVCAVEAVEDHDTTPGGSMPETFTQEELDAALAAATDPLQQRLAELEAQVQQTEVGKAVADAVAAKDAEVAELQSQLDAVEAARTAAENKLTEVEQYWVDAIAAQEAAAELAARKEQRTTQAREAGVFSEEYIAENADRFASMTDEDFSARLDEWRLIASQPRRTSDIPARTALVAARADEPVTGSALSVISEMRAKRVDPRTLGGVQ